MSKIASPKQLPLPLFDTLENLNEPIPACVASYIAATNIDSAAAEHQLTRKFLESYSGSNDTFNAYRREVERFLHWAWLVAAKPLKSIDRNDIRKYIEFSKQPPIAWIATQNAARFIVKDELRSHNPKWRPFVVRISKAQHRQGGAPDKEEYALSNKSIASLMAGLSTFFTFLQQERYLEIHPVQLVRQKSQIIQKQQSYKVIRKLSRLQWQYVIETVEKMAATNPEYERHLFLLTIFYLLGLRISEVSDTPRHTPTMGDFAPDKNDRWWFTTVGKGNKLRDVAVPDAMLDALKRYRRSLNLTSLPPRGDHTPLLAKQRGRGNLGSRQVRNLIQLCFDQAVARLDAVGKLDEAQDLAAATVHWLRHTAISADVEHRPREHVRDDAGHESAVITDHYIDADRVARHESARHKQLHPLTSALPQQSRQVQE
jgi:site-specific recombinase XerD